MLYDKKKLYVENVLDGAQLPGPLKQRALSKRRGRGVPPISQVNF